MLLGKVTFSPTPCLHLAADAEAVPVRQIDNSAVLTAQLARLAQVKASRDGAAVAAALQAIEAAARSSERQPNLMELAVQVGVHVQQPMMRQQPGRADGVLAMA